MNTTNMVLLAALITVGGQWADKKTLSAKIAVGTFFTALGLAALSMWDAKLGKNMSLLILVGAVLFNGPALFKAVKGATD